MGLIPIPKPLNRIISGASSLDATTLASNDALPVLDVSGTTDDQQTKKIIIDELIKYVKASDVDLNLPYYKLVGDPPPPTSPEFKPWLDRLIEKRLTNNPIIRSAVLYFANSGNDSTGNGTISTPYQTLAKAQAIADASNGDITFAFKGGDTFRESTAFNSTKDKITITSYGTGKAKFNGFTVQYNSSGWTADSGNLYHRTEASTVRWIKEVSDTYPYQKIYTKQDSSAHVAAHTYSWYQTGSTLYINTGGNANSVNLEVSTNASSTWNLGGKTGRLDKLIIEGYGIGVPEGTASYELTFSANNDLSEFVISDCDVFYGGYHEIGFLGGGARVIGTAIRTRFGLGTNQPFGQTPIVAYCDNGGQEFICVDCVCGHGTLPDYHWTDGSNFYATYAFSGALIVHTANSTTAALVALIRTAIPANYYQVGGYGVVGVPIVSRAEDARCWIINENNPSIKPAFENLADGTVVLNGYYDFGSPTTSGTKFAVFDGGDGGGWVYNTYFKIDATNIYAFGAGVGWWAHNTGSVTFRFDHCRFEATYNGAEQFYLTGVGTHLTGNFYVKNSIFTLTSSVNKFLLGYNPSDFTSSNLSHNAYYSSAGYTDDPISKDSSGQKLASFPIATDTPSIANGLFNTGVDTGLRFDILFNPRDVLHTDVGPYSGLGLNRFATWDLNNTLNGQLTFTALPYTDPGTPGKVYQDGSGNLKISRFTPKAFGVRLQGWWEYLAGKLWQDTVNGTPADGASEPIGIIEGLGDCVGGNLTGSGGTRPSWQTDGIQSYYPSSQVLSITNPIVLAGDFTVYAVAYIESATPHFWFINNSSGTGIRLSINGSSQYDTTDDTGTNHTHSWTGTANAKSVVRFRREGTTVYGQATGQAEVTIGTHSGTFTFNEVLHSNFFGPAIAPNNRLLLLVVITGSVTTDEAALMNIFTNTEFSVTL